MPDRHVAKILDGLEQAATLCGQIRDDHDAAISAERKAKADLLRAVAAAMAPAIGALRDEQAIFAGEEVRLIELRSRRRGRIYLVQRDEECFFARKVDGEVFRVDDDEIVREVDLPMTVRALAERLRAAITGATVRRTERAQLLAEKLFALEVLLRDETTRR